MKLPNHWWEQSDISLPISYTLYGMNNQFALRAIQNLNFEWGQFNSVQISFYNKYTFVTQNFIQYNGTLQFAEIIIYRIIYIKSTGYTLINILAIFNVLIVYFEPQSIQLQLLKVLHNLLIAYLLYTYSRHFEISK